MGVGVASRPLPRRGGRGGLWVLRTGLPLVASSLPCRDSARRAQGRRGVPGHPETRWASATAPIKQAPSVSPRGRRDGMNPSRRQESGAGLTSVGLRSTGAAASHIPASQQSPAVASFSACELRPAGAWTGPHTCGGRAPGGLGTRSRRRNSAGTSGPSWQWPCARGRADAEAGAPGSRGAGRVAPVSRGNFLGRQEAHKAGGRARVLHRGDRGARC